MWLSLCLFLISFHVFQTDLHPSLSTIIGYLHEKCLSILPHQTTFPQVYEALVCGERIKAPDLQEVFVTTGLLHVFVVSGMHLSGLHRFLSRLKIPFVLQVALLAIYALATNLNPPVVRAWFSLCLSSARERFALHWSRTLLVWHVSLIALLFFSKWYDSFSFLLSWSASLALALGQNKSILAKNLIVYFVMAPLLGSLSHPHPLSVLVNTLFLPLFGLFFFPLTLCSVLIPPLTWVMDQAWSLLFEVLQTIAGNLPLFKPAASLNLQQGFFYLVGLHFVIILQNYWVKHKTCLQKGSL